MKELEAAIQNAFSTMVSSGQLGQIIEDNVRKCVTEVIKGAFDYHSNFKKALTEHLNENLKVDLHDIGLAGYNDFLLKVVKAKLDASVFKFGEQLIAKELDELLMNPPAEIKLSELVEQFRKHLRDEDRDGSAVTCRVIHSDTSDKWGTVKLDAKPRVAAGECRYDIAYSDKGEVYRIGLPYSGDVTKKVFAGPFFGFDRMLFQMYAAKTRLIIDEENVSTGD